MRYTAFALMLLAVASYASNNYDYYVLATEWAGSVCSEQTCNYADGISKTVFNLHGLWPSLSTKPMSPFNCPNVAWSSSYLTANTVSLMKTYWSGLYSSADGFHDHEWSKHGSCWENDAAQKTNPIDDFMNKALQLSAKYNVYSILANAGITPGSTYSLDSIKAALNSVFKPSGYCLQCKSGNFNEIHVCLDRSYNPITCPADTAHISCPGNVNYPNLSI
eukprot:CAMPEP_0176443140 /NCGR_PEP_ID=MMETSP0127-20121128/22240_1 /TAXON_ID=938130 /ORGANISM="Platyophrya macrostoma, Strain WH" /LENGTH=219 /DNA_ID=CAMNT_0017828301 /DNA_START=35 /DNA_END=694 /DNA_ORIENTATION=-